MGDAGIVSFGSGVVERGGVVSPVGAEGLRVGVLADHRFELFPADVFADLFPSGRGRPSVPADVIASAMILKELEGLSGRQAADAVRCDIHWKVACGLALDDEGVYYTCSCIGVSVWPGRSARIASATRSLK